MPSVTIKDLISVPHEGRPRGKTSRAQSLYEHQICRCELCLASLSSNFFVCVDMHCSGAVTGHAPQCQKSIECTSLTHVIRQCSRLAPLRVIISAVEALPPVLAISKAVFVGTFGTKRDTHRPHQLHLPSTHPFSTHNQLPPTSHPVSSRPKRRIFHSLAVSCYLLLTLNAAHRSYLPSHWQ